MIYLWTFIVGGILCVIAQVLIDKTKMTPARILVSYVVAGVILTALKFAGAGATVPLTGFGYSLAKGVEKAVDESGAFGIITGGLRGTAGGITAAMLFSLIASLVFKGKNK